MIRNMRELDLEQIMKIWLEGNCQAHRFIDRAYWEMHYEPVREAIRRAEVYVYEEKGRVEGFIGLDGDYIAGIFVMEEARSKGIGRGLLDHVKAMHRVLSLKVYERNERGVRFYQREGFAIQERGRDPETGETEFTMRWETGRSRRSQEQDPALAG